MSTWRECREAVTIVKENYGDGVSATLADTGILLEYIAKLETANKQLLSDVREWLE